MATLSKQVTEAIAEKMTLKSKKYADAMYKQLQKVTTEIYEDQIPIEVMKVFKNHYEFIETTQSVYLDGHGFNRKTISLTKQLPSRSRYNATLKLNAVIADRIMKASKKYDKAKQDFEELLLQTKSALTTLKTNKNIRENLPEAIPFLPPPVSNSLVVNFDSLKNRLNKQPEVKEAVTN